MAQAWVDEIKAGRSMSDIMQAHKDTRRHDLEAHPPRLFISQTFASDC